MLVEVWAASYMATGLNFENRAVEVLTRHELKFCVCLHAKRTHLPVLRDIDIAGYPRIKYAIYIPVLQPDVTSKYKIVRMVGPPHHA